MQSKDHYQTLGLKKSATADDIKKAYRKQARKYHPDVSKEADAGQRIIEINQAHDVLSDPDKRASYDEFGPDGPPTRAPGARRPPAGFEFTDRGAQEAGYSDFFDEMFGSGHRAGQAPRYRHDEAAMHIQRGSDHHARIELDLQDAYDGADRTITLQSTRLADDGQPMREERRLQVKIPKGVREGQHIRLVGRGSPGLGGAPAGDLFLEVSFRLDARWHAEGRDVYQRVPLAPWEAVLGGQVKVRTPGGETEVSVPAPWRAGRKLRLKGRGIPGAVPGDLYLELDISLPPADSEVARAAYVAMAQAFPAFNPR